MAIRSGYTVGRNTGEASLADQLKKFSVKTLNPPQDAVEIISLRDPSAAIKRGPNPAHESLKVLHCLM